MITPEMASAATPISHDSTPSMPERHDGYRVEPFPAAQQILVDWAEIMVQQHTIHGLLEFDVTETRRAIHRQRRVSGEPLSFTALMVASFARAVGADPGLQAYRAGRRRIVVFDDVDVAVLVEQKVDGERVPVPHIVRAANRKSPTEVDREIREARSGGDPYGGMRRFAPLWLAVPAIVRRFVLRRVLADPRRRKRLTGTAAVSAVGMFGIGTGWGVPFISQSICLTVGGIGRRPGLNASGSVEPRDMVSLTISVDHDVVNGAPLARFMSRFRDSLESAALLKSE
jgi:pyruvate/2-oxoglutarate dehydrogenase complex dihydrolipoamide acyltransferase (E2) component